MATKYLKQWHIPSASDKNKTYTVSLTTSNEYVCHCWPFLRTRKECTHILLAKSGSYENIEPPSERERSEILLRQYAEKGYRYIEWMSEYEYPWEKDRLERIRHSDLYEDVKTFKAEGRKIIVAKEKPWVYEQEIESFRTKITSINWRTIKNRKGLKEAFRKQYFNMTQHIIFNSTGVINPNLPDGSVYTNGTYGKMLHQLEMRYKWLR